METENSQERAASLERQIGIYESECQERKELYENLLEEKIRVEKEAVSKLGGNSTEIDCEKVFQEGLSTVGGYIESLLELEQAQQRQVRQLLA